MVYEHPSVEKLAAYIIRLQSGEAGSESQHETKMLALLEKWIGQVRPRSADIGQPAKPLDSRVIVRFPFLMTLGLLH